jgi:hypothetical protein
MNYYIKNATLVNEGQTFVASVFVSDGKIAKIIRGKEDGPSTGSGTFAFQMGDQLVVNGEGELQIIDMLGRVVMTDQLTGSQSTTNLPKTAGVYVLRLTDTNGTRTQKMVIR